MYIDYRSPLWSKISLCGMIHEYEQQLFNTWYIMHHTLAICVTLMENIGLEYFVSIYPSPPHTSCIMNMRIQTRIHTCTHTHLLREQTDGVVKNSWQGFDETPLPSGRYGRGWGGVCEERYLITLLFFLCIPLHLSLSNTQTHGHTQVIRLPKEGNISVRYHRALIWWGHLLSGS